MTAPNPHEPAPVSAPVDYDPATVEAKWQNRWRERGTNHTDIAEGERPFYALMMFPYPSAEGLHVGNLFAFTGNDIYGRFHRQQGHTVFEPLGYDAFGIHSENYALKVGIHPMRLIPANIANFRRQASIRASRLATKALKGIGLLTIQGEPGVRKSGTPDSVEMPAPVKATTDAARSSMAWRSSIASLVSSCIHRSGFV